MILRQKSGGFVFREGPALMEYLGVRENERGARKVRGDVELFSSLIVRVQAEGNEGQKGIAWTFSTFDLDRYGERIDPSGWDFARYMENPVIEWAHCYSVPAIGRADGLYSDNEGLHGVLYFNDKSYDPFGWSIGERVRAGVIRAGSVGFRVIEIEIPDKETAKDGTSLIFRKQELLEFSICNVPANPFALTMSNGEKAGLPAGNEQGILGRHFWGGLINNFEE